MTVLEIDAGNSRIKWRVQGYAAGQKKQLAKGVFVAARQPEDLAADLDRLLASLADMAIDKVLVSNVRGKTFAAELEACCKRQLDTDPVFAKIENHQNGVSSSYTEPGRMGIDRWLAMQSVYAGNRAAACIVDCGSAMTIDLLNADGQHGGGFIVPGLTLLQSSLHSSTAELPFQAAQHYAIEPGASTSQAIQHGAINMQLGMLQRVYRNWATQRQWYLCGGDAELLASFIEWPCSLQPDLVLDGLELVCGTDREL